MLGVGKRKNSSLIDEKEIRAAAQKVVDATKRTARVDTGALKRSVSYTYVRGLVTFRELFYGAYHKNAELLKNAKKIMPKGSEWVIQYVNFGGETIETTTKQKGTNSLSSILKVLNSGSTTKIKALIAKNKAKRAKKDWI